MNVISRVIIAGRSGIIGSGAGSFLPGALIAVESLKTSIAKHIRTQLVNRERNWITYVRVRIHPAVEIERLLSLTYKYVGGSYTEVRRFTARRYT